MPSPERKAVMARVSSPGYTAAQNGRKSEAAEFGMIPGQTTPASQPQAQRRVSDSGRRASDGWIVVNVDGSKQNGDPAEGSLTRPSYRPRSSSQPSLTLSHITNGNGHVPTPEQAQAGSMSAAAKAIVIIDAVDAKAQKGKDGSTFRRLFSLNKSETTDPSEDHSKSSIKKRRGRSESRGVSKTRGFEQEEKAQKSSSSRGWYR
jgi:hypothetical protein